MATELKAMFKRFMEEYAVELEDARTTKKYKRPFGALVRKDIVEKMQAQVDRSIYKVKGSVGAGRWTDVPWIAVFDTRMTKSAQKGVYIVYLLNKDSKELFLTLNQGVTDVAQGGGNSSDGKLTFTGIATSSNGKITTDLKEKAKKIREKIGNESGLQYGDIDSGSEAYNAGCIFFKKYDLKTLPEDEQLYQDLLDFVEVYNSYYEKIFVKNTVDGWLPRIDTYDPGITKEKWIELLNDPSVFEEENLLAMACLYDNAGEGSCTELGKKYHRSMTLWTTSCGVYLAERIANKTGCPRLQEDGKTVFFVIPFLYRKTSLDEIGSFIYKLRPE